MSDVPASPRALLVHRGELADVRAALCAMGIDVFERAGKVHPREAAQAWSLVVATPQLVPDLPFGQTRPTCIAVVQRATRTLEAHLRRGGVDFVLRRPFHPAALRLLVLRALYRGPERRRDRRVPIGAHVRLRLGLQVGLRPVDALLIDLSEQGCRLRPAQPLARGAGVRVVLGSELTGGRALALRGEISHPAETNGEWVVRFRRLGVRRERRLAAVLDRHAGGPAALPAPVAAVEPSDAERRRSPRRPFRRRVIALGEEAARVLVGRDLSLGGMRVDPDAKLRVGESLRLAIHGGGHDEPVLVDAEVMRDEAERGYVLRFVRIPDNARRVLEAMLCEAPDVADPNTEGEAGDLVLSQIVAASP